MLLIRDGHLSLPYTCIAGKENKVFFTEEIQAQVTTHNLAEMSKYLYTDDSQYYM